MGEALEILLGGALFLGSFGPVLGLEANIQPLRYDERIEAPTFGSYLDRGIEQYGEGIGTTLWAAWTYPGVPVGIAVHNSLVPE